MVSEPIQCPRCGDMVPPDKSVCPNCKKILLRQQGHAVNLSAANGSRLADAGTKLTNCPVCKIPIYPAKMGGYDILHCAECDSTAFKREVLMKMQATDSKKIAIGPQEQDHVTPPYFEKRDKPPFLICPFCGKKMLAKKLGVMQADMCEECKAVFLDGEKYKHINEILGAYKMSIMNAARDTRRRR
jgi:Zn-finger nucleic acid-binding protein